jgi:hypothetical protein
MRRAQVSFGDGLIAEEVSAGALIRISVVAIFMIADGICSRFYHTATKVVTPAGCPQWLRSLSHSAIATSYSQIRALPGRIYSDRQGVKFVRDGARAALPGLEKRPTPTHNSAS